VPVRQWVVSFPIPLRHLFATQPHLLFSVLQVIHRALTTSVIHQAGLTHAQAQTGAVTLIQRFGSAANLNIHLHGLMLDGVYHLTDEVPIFQPIPPPTTEQLQTVLTRIIMLLLKVLTRHGALIEEDTEIPYLTSPDADPALAPLHAAVCTYRNALGPRIGQKVLTWEDPSLRLANPEVPQPQGCAPKPHMPHCRVMSGPILGKWALQPGSGGTRALFRRQRVGIDPSTGSLIPSRPGKKAF